MECRSGRLVDVHSAVQGCSSRVTIMAPLPAKPRTCAQLGLRHPSDCNRLLLAGGILTTVATVEVAGVAARAWVARHRSVPFRIVLTVVAAASILFTGWLLTHGCCSGDGVRDDPPISEDHPVAATFHPHTASVAHTAQQVNTPPPSTR